MTEMKKRVIGLLLSAILVFGLIGCGNSSETKQETNAGADQEVDAGTEQEEKKDIETDNFVFLAEVGEQEYILESFEWEEASVKFTTKYETNIYNIEGRNIGYIKPDVPVEITEHGINSGWYRFKNPEVETDYEYLCVLRDDVEAQGGEALQVQDENGVIDTEMMWIYPEDYEYGNDKEISPDLTWTECNVEFTNKDVIQLYNDGGKNVAWLHNVTVTFTEENEEWYRFKNTESNIDSEYLLVSKSSIESQNQYLEEQGEYTKQQKMYDEAMSLIDENKTYTIEEFHQLMKDICEIIGTEYDSNLVSNSEGMPGERTLNLKGKKLKQFFEEEQFIWWLMMGPTGSNKMDVYIYIEDGIDTSEDFEVLVFSRYHKE